MRKWIGLLLAVLMTLGIYFPTLGEKAIDPIGTVEGNTYTNEFFDFQASFPDHWNILSESEMADFMEFDQKYASRDGLRELLETQSSTYGLCAQTNDGTHFNLIFTIENLGNHAHWTEQECISHIKDMLPSFLSAQGYTDVKMALQSFIVAGKEHAGAVLTGTRILSNIPIYQALIFIKADQYIGSLTITAMSEEAVQQIISYIEPLNDAPLLARQDQHIWSVIGSICGTSWDTDFPMTETSPGVWRSSPLDLKAKDEFKVREDGSWAVNYGDGGVLDGYNIVVPADGTYTVILDLNAQTLIYVDETGAMPEAFENPQGELWSVIGTLYGTNWDTDFPMFESSPGIWMSSPLELKAGDEFKVRLNGTWAINYGITDGILMHNGDNIPVSENGTFIIILDLNTLNLTVTAP